MKYLNIYTFMVLASLICSCGNKTTSVNNLPKKDSVPQKDTTVLVTEKVSNSFYYEGQLPCSKCDGMKTTVFFSDDNQSAEISFSHLDNPFVEESYNYTMNTERGYEKDEDATVYILNWDKPENEQRVFVRETWNDSTIFEIKSNRKRFSDKKNHTLIKKDLN